jgi:cytochrome c oxidase subunit 6a
MLSQRAVLGAARRLPTQIRQPVQRRWASSAEQFTGAQDNAFNRERAAVKAHAAESAGEYEGHIKLRESIWAMD